MAAVRGGRGRGGRHLPEGEAPDAHVAEESKKVVKELVARQTQAGTSLDQQLARGREREFHRAAAVLPLSSVASGASSLADFTASAERARRTEDLAGTGLPLDDLQLLLDHEDGAGEESRLSLPERLAREERLREIRHQLAVGPGPSTASSAATSTAPSGQQPGPSRSRHLQELEASLQAAGRMTPMARLALAKPGQDGDDDDGGGGGDDAEVPRFREPAPYAPDHPALRLGALERRRFGHLDAVLLEGTPSAPSATSRKRRRQRQAVDQPKALHGHAADSAMGEGGTAVSAATGSLWDVRDTAAAEARLARPSAQATTSERRPHGPARAKQYTIQDGKIVPLGAAAAPSTARTGAPTGALFTPTGHGVLSVEDLRKTRMSLEEIRQLPRFASYDAGAPSTVLYVKNLDGGVTEDDLAAVFGSFQDASAPRLTMRLCTGRMRGQAFVTFPSQEAAGAALDAANGFLLRGRPMILQYGRGQS